MATAELSGCLARAQHAPAAVDAAKCPILLFVWNSQVGHLRWILEVMSRQNEHGSASAADVSAAAVER